VYPMIPSGQSVEELMEEPIWNLVIIIPI
jgi:hypothetical protein